MTREEAVEKMINVRKLMEEIREWTNSPAVDSALRIADTYCFLVLEHLGGETALCPEVEE